MKNARMLGILSMLILMPLARAGTLGMESWRAEDTIEWNQQLLPEFKKLHPDIDISFTPTPTDYDKALALRLRNGNAAGEETLTEHVHGRLLALGLRDGTVGRHRQVARQERLARHAHLRKRETCIVEIVAHSLAAHVDGRNAGHQRAAGVAKRNEKRLRAV